MWGLGVGFFFVHREYFRRRVVVAATKMERPLAEMICAYRADGLL